MKKILLSVLMFVSSIGMFAVNYTNKVTIAMSDGTYFPNLVIGESNDAGFAGGVLVNGYFGLVQDLASTPLSVYAYYQDEAYENLVLDDFTNVPMGIKTTNSTGYSLYFAGLTGSFTIYDTKEQVTIDCTETYHFTIDDAEKNSIINDRFVINYKDLHDGIGEVPSDQVPCTKVLRDGQIYILSGSKTYNLQGMEVK